MQNSLLESAVCGDVVDTEEKKAELLARIESMGGLNPNSSAEVAQFHSMGTVRQIPKGGVPPEAFAAQAADLVAKRATTHVEALNRQRAHTESQRTCAVQQ
jgi:hypothetical protein